MEAKIKVKLNGKEARGLLASLGAPSGAPPRDRTSFIVRATRRSIGKRPQK